MNNRKWWFIGIAIFFAIGVTGCSSSDKESFETEENEEIVTEEVNEEKNVSLDAETEQNISEEENDANNEEDEEKEIKEEKVKDKEDSKPIPAPIVYEGSGDDFINIEKPEEGPVVLKITGNSENKHFSVSGFDHNDNYTELFVNTTDEYEGITLDSTGETSELEISSQGAWSVESLSSRSLKKIEVPGTVEGVGDDVFLVEGNSKKANVTGNKSESHFSVTSYNPNHNLLINTTDAYEGTIKIDRDTYLIEVTAVGDWSIEFE